MNACMRASEIYSRGHLNEFSALFEMVEDGFG